MACLLVAPASWAACTYPAGEVNIPDGATATEQELAEAQSQVKSFLAEMQEYLECLDAEERAAEAAAAESGEPLSEEQRELHVKRHNAAVDAMHAVADNFNVEVREFKARGD